MARTRRILQILFLLFFAILFILARYPYTSGISSDIFLRFSPLPPIFHFIDNLTIPGWFWPALIILFLTPFLGRFFCGWICPLGTSLDLFHRLFKSPTNKISGKWVKLRWLKYGIQRDYLLNWVCNYLEALSQKVRESEKYISFTVELNHHYSNFY